jgi:hypothetical protein
MQAGPRHIRDATETNAAVCDNFHWRDLRGLGKLLVYGFPNQFQHARSTRWKRRRGFRPNSLPIR